MALATVPLPAGFIEHDGEVYELARCSDGSLEAKHVGSLADLLTQEGQNSE